VAALLGISAEEARRYEGGPFAVLYLCPTDYHRVHVPLESQISTWRYQPGTLWPVFPTATRKVEELFANNERLVFDLDTDFGRIGQVMVGAFGVGRMTTVLGPGATNDSGGFARSEARSTRLERGAELGRFELGSTVILVGEPGRFEWIIQPGEPVRLGRPIARRC
jgi:phosphatidylserine decarboxylase